jgi:hypothetical protein
MLKKMVVGQVMEIDNEDGEYFVDFLETTGKIPNRFRRPNSDRSDLCFSSSLSLSDNDLCILHSFFALRRQYIAGNSTIRSLCIFALD